MSEFFAMGGYAFYVWLSYLLVAVVMGANVMAPLYRGRKLMRQLKSGAGTARRRGR